MPFPVAEKQAEAMDEKRSSVSSAVKNAALGLHKGAGLWRPGLREWIGPELRRIWRITEHDPVSRVRAVVVLRLKAVLDALGRDDLAFVVWTAYNLGVTPASDKLEDRLKRLEPEVKKRTCQRRVKDFLDELENSLLEDQPELEEWELLEAERWLEHNTRPTVEPALRTEPGGEVTKLLSILSSPEEWFPRLVSRSIDVFLTGRRHAPAAADGAPLVVDLGERGIWMCVFTERELLDEYRAVTDKRWEKTLTATGRHFVGLAHARPEPTGVLIDPSASRGAGAGTTLPLPPVEIARLVGGPDGERRR